MSRILDKVSGLTLDDRLAFCSAPATLNDRSLAAALLEFAKKYSEGLNVHCKLRIPTHHPRNAHDLRRLEIALQATQYWIYLSQRLDTSRFVRQDLAIQKYRRLVELFDLGLEALSKNQLFFPQEEFLEDGEKSMEGGRSEYDWIFWKFRETKEMVGQVLQQEASTKQSLREVYDFRLQHQRGFE